MSVKFHPDFGGRFVNRPYGCGALSLICAVFAGAQCTPLRFARIFAGG
uniref:Uncharacterized protein n=1 Tax=Myoviridae sp. ctr9D2 TaxID=2827711 RepID=A0A8S5SIT4_9CAUD|nr:MAG TPA: hypothetical protein [Myoviridae sp. ctr9D2]